MTDWKEVYILLRESKEWEKLKGYLKNLDKYKSPKVEDIWCIINQVWDDMGLNYTDYNLD